MEICELSVHFPGGGHANSQGSGYIAVIDDTAGDSGKDLQEESIALGIQSREEVLQVPAHTKKSIPSGLPFSSLLQEARSIKGQPWTFRHASHFISWKAHAQILSKIARGFDQDLEDARKMMATKDPGILLELFNAVRPDLIRYPAIDEKALAGKVARFLEKLPGGAG